MSAPALVEDDVAVSWMWRRRAACLDGDPEWWCVWGPRLTVENLRALRICAGCPVREACRLAADEEEGSSDVAGLATIRGAETPTDRVRRRRGLPEGRRRLGLLSCRSCGRLMSSNREVVGEGLAAREHDKTLCAACWVARRRAELERHLADEAAERERRAMSDCPSRCLQCQRPMVPRSRYRAGVARPRFSVVHAGEGLCVSCMKQRRRAERAARSEGVSR